eukprot:1071458-Rhodomonas_salina.2
MGARARCIIPARPVAQRLAVRSLNVMMMMPGRSSAIETAFCQGKRNCIGQNLANMQLQKTPVSISAAPRTDIVLCYAAARCSTLSRRFCSATTSS